MIIFLYGPDVYRRGKKYGEIVREYLKKNGESNFLAIDCETDEDYARKAVDFLRQGSIFTSSKLLTLKNFEKIQEDDNVLMTEIKQILSSENVFVLITSGSGLVNDFEFLRQKPVIFQEFKELKGVELQVFLKKQAAEFGLILEPAAINFLADYVSSFPDKTWRAAHEIQKTVLSGFAAPVELKDVKTIINWMKADDIFRYALKINALNNSVERFFYLEAVMALGGEPRHLFNLLSGLSKRDADVISLANLDVLIKSGLMDDEVALTAFAAGC